jgi:hypothetical protein
MRVHLRACAVLLLLAWVSGSALAADEAVPIAFKYAQGDMLRYDVSFSGVGNLAVPGVDSTSVGMQGSCGVSQSVLKVDEDGTAVLETLLPRADMTVTVKDQQARFSYADGRLRWFTNGQEQTPPQMDLSKAPLLQAPLNITTKPDGTVTSIGFSNTEFLEMLAKAVPGMPVGLLGQNLPMTNSSPILPSAPVKVGETWTRTDKLPIGTGQYMDVTMKRTLESVTKQGGLEIAKIMGSGEAKFRGNPKISAPGGQKMDISIGELKETFGSTEFFNLGTGRLVRGEYQVRFVAKMAAAMMGQAQHAEVTFRMIGSVVGR